MKTRDINIRDPYVLTVGDTYYLYGTRSATCWGPADGFDCYTGTDLEHWEGPFEVFHRPEGFFADRCYWAPECYACGGRYYLLATLAGGARNPGVYVLTADSPLGPFVPAGDRPLTPEGWACIDGSLYRDGAGTPYLLFSHSFEDDPAGGMYAVELSGDLLRAVSAPHELFRAADAPWAAPAPFAREQFHIDGDVYLSDGPCVHSMEDGSLLLLWASWSERGYAVGAARSDSGSVYGPWRHLPDKIFQENGGHGMLFRTKEGRLLYTLHYPNTLYEERPIFAPVAEGGGTLVLLP